MQKFGRNCNISADFCPALATQYTDPDEIVPVNIDYWPTVACQIWPR